MCAELAIKTPVATQQMCLVNKPIYIPFSAMALNSLHCALT